MKGKKTWATDPGRVRDENQDAVLCADDLSCYAISDGMGGVFFGKQSAELVCEKLRSCLQGIHPVFLESEEAEGFLKEIIRQISDEIGKKANGTSSQVLYGATLTGIYPRGNHAILFHVGDSRAYLLRKGECLERLTRDDNIYEVLQGTENLSFSPEEEQELQNRLMQYMGMPGGIVPMIRRVAVEHGDRFLICSDGLTKMLREDTIQSILQEKSDTEECAKELILAANAAGGQDNISVIIWDAE